MFDFDLQKTLGYTPCMRSYKLIDHSADMGMEFSASTLEELFIASAEGLFSETCETDTIRCREIFFIRAEGVDREDLLVSWLRELIYLSQVKGVLLKKFRIKLYGEKTLEAEAEGEPYDKDRHLIKREVKAATYHGLNISLNEGLWKARVVFDL